MRSTKCITILMGIGLIAAVEASSNLDWNKSVGHAISVNCPTSGTPPYDFWRKLFETHGLSTKAFLQVAENSGVVRSRVSYTGNHSGLFNKDQILTANSAIEKIATSHGCVARAHVSQHRAGL